MAWHIRSNANHAKRVLEEIMSMIDEAYPDIALHILDSFNSPNGVTSRSQRSQPSRALVNVLRKRWKPEVEKKDTDPDWQEEAEKADIHPEVSRR